MVPEETKSKKQKNEDCIINCLPRDLMERLFLKLPVSTLVTCFIVCKHWYHFIRDPQFVTSHLQHAPRYALLFFPQELASGKLYPSDAILIDEAWSPSTYAVPVIGPDDFLFGSCNGLLGLYTKTSTIKIANLATGECLHLEKPVKNMRGDHFSFYNFGFHPVTEEYKITHFLGDCTDTEAHPRNKHRFSVIQVYTLGDEKWRDVPTPEILSLDIVRNSGVVNVDGKMFWLTEHMTASWQHAVISFDLKEECFSMIQLPEEREDYAYIQYGPREFWIRDIDDKICIVTAQCASFDGRFLVGELQIWTLDNILEQRWSKKYSIQNPPNYIPGPHFVHKDRLMAQLTDCSVWSYELLCENFEINKNAYKKAGIVRTPKQRAGWESKKWEAWEDELRKVEVMGSRVHKFEHDLECRKKLVNYMSFCSRRDTTQHNVYVWKSNRCCSIRETIQINVLQPRSLRRFNFLEQKREKENLMARSSRMMEMMKAMKQLHDKIHSLLRSPLSDQRSFMNYQEGLQSGSDGEALRAGVARLRQEAPIHNESRGVTDTIRIEAASREDQADDEDDINI
ncbi:F-box protein CPR1 isoform X3 [Brachypodium distachyon]|uniref:F-box protein CPR1 isoform X3 n=1 Tax=Brachypodium distachyon TaxID=15368 RepID=UPI000D0D0ED9|nr:F-box protein CPR1 isoform X3 [Brachypodium distachyon]|eukprot:XP_024319018.1 F-box protein CPR1 isoform X3 [Brachypodium distachyon]